MPVPVTPIKPNTTSDVAFRHQLEAIRPANQRYDEDSSMLQLVKLHFSEACSVCVCVPSRFPSDHFEDVAEVQAGVKIATRSIHRLGLSARAPALIMPALVRKGCWFIHGGELRPFDHRANCFGFSISH